MERAWTFDGAAAKESEENKENLRVSSDPDGDLLLCQDEEALNDSVISGEHGPGLAGRGRAAGSGHAAGDTERACFVVFTCVWKSRGSARISAVPLLSVTWREAGRGPSGVPSMFGSVAGPRGEAEA